MTDVEFAKIQDDNKKKAADMSAAKQAAKQVKQAAKSLSKKAAAVAGIETSWSFRRFALPQCRLLAPEERAHMRKALQARFFLTNHLP